MARPALRSVLLSRKTRRQSLWNCLGASAGVHSRAAPAPGPRGPRCAGAEPGTAVQRLSSSSDHPVLTPASRCGNCSGELPLWGATARGAQSVGARCWAWCRGGLGPVTAKGARGRSAQPSPSRNSLHHPTSARSAHASPAPCHLRLAATGQTAACLVLAGRLCLDLPFTARNTCAALCPAPCGRSPGPPPAPGPTHHLAGVAGGQPLDPATRALLRLSLQPLSGAFPTLHPELTSAQGPGGDRCLSKPLLAPQVAPCLPPSPPRAGAPGWARFLHPHLCDGPCLGRRLPVLSTRSFVLPQKDGTSSPALGPQSLRRFPPRAPRM